MTRKVIAGYFIGTSQWGKENSLLGQEETETLFYKGDEIFRIVESFGSSGAKDINHFKYAGDVMDYVEKQFDWRVLGRYGTCTEHNNYENLALALTELKSGILKRVRVNMKGDVIKEVSQ